VVAALVAALTLTRGPNRHTVTAEFTDVRGLVTGAPVRLAGAPVGEVAGVWLGPDGWPRVRLSIDDWRLGRTRGRAAGVPERRVEQLRVDRAGTAELVHPPLANDQPGPGRPALSAFDPATESSLKQLLGGLRTTLAGEGPALAATLRESQAALDEIGGLAGDVGSDGGSLSLAVSSSATIASTLARRSPSLVGCGPIAARACSTQSPSERARSMPACAGCRRGSAPRPRRSGARGC